jgi:hypothetical protein
MSYDPEKLTTRMAHDLIDKCSDLTDERETIRTLRDAGYSYGDIVTHIDAATKMAVQLIAA